MFFLMQFCKNFCPVLCMLVLVCARVCARVYMHMCPLTCVQPVEVTSLIFSIILHSVF